MHRLRVPDDWFSWRYRVAPRALGSGCTCGESFRSQCDWWERRSGLERALAASCALLFVSCIVLLALHLVTTEQLRWAASPADGENICYSVECIRAATGILDRANLSADPCVDFDAFACGGFAHSHAVPDDHYHATVLVSMQDDIFVRLQKLLEEPSAMNESTAVGKVRGLYQSCMNTSSVEEGSVDILRGLLRDDDGGIGSWPVLQGSSWNPSQLNLERRLARLRLHNVEPFFQLHVGQDDRNASNPVYVLQMFSGSPVIRSEYYLNATDERSREFVRLYRDLMTQAVRLLGAEPAISRADMDDLFAFEVEFANVTHTSEYDGSSSSVSGGSNETLTIDSAMVTVSLTELQSMAPELDWTFLLKSVLEQGGLSLDELNLNVTVENDGGSYMRRLFELINKTSPRTVANYLSWRFVASYMPYLDVHFRRLYGDFRRRVPGAQDERTFLARWKECLRLLSDGFGLALASLFVRSDFPAEETDIEVGKLIKEIKHTYAEETLPRQAFLDERTRDICREKVQAMGQKVGFPKFILDSNQLDEEYNGLQVNEDHFLMNVLQLQRYEVTKELKKLTKPVDKDRDWVTNPLIVNAFYDFRGNYAMYPLGILRSPMLRLNRPQYLNYGTLGVVIGHEITHGFAGFGKKYDRHGNMSTWWSDEAVEQLRHRAECFVEQFSKFPLNDPGTYVNGNTTLEENVCDSTAVNIAYHSYKRWVSEHGTEPRLPVLGLTNEQVYFMQYAQIWCEVVSDEGYKRYETEQHSPGKHSCQNRTADDTLQGLPCASPRRSNGALQNSMEFAKTFGCPVGSPMNPVKKCKLWD
ncbi:neprilysin-1-like isoform X2 [Ornithodoros turicata]|uniref:neprilysin-1-like isoform X2 n=1 Tax=Ornithodoros turicata TaxID=34597 RepID=UPI003139AF9F